MNFITSHNGNSIRVFCNSQFTSFTFLCEPSIMLTSILCNLKSKIEHFNSVKEVIIGIDSISIFHTPGYSKELQNNIFSFEFDINPCMQSEFTIKVNYGGQDIDNVCEALSLSKQELIKLHTDTSGYVAMLGFLPGFVYIGGGNPKLNLPRKIKPSSAVEAGSIAIATGYTGIYPIASPGGWHIIGHTEFKNFNIHNQPHCRLKIGDKIIFVDGNE